MNELVKRLTTPQDVEAGVRAENKVEEFKAAIDRGYAHIKFVRTKGGTELGVQLEKDRCDLSGADFSNKKGIVKLAGTLTLNYENVRCHAEIDLATLKGTGYLEHLSSAEPGKNN
jgi:hypothetical protein